MAILDARREHKNRERDSRRRGKAEEHRRESTKCKHAGHGPDDEERRKYYKPNTKILKIKKDRNLRSFSFEYVLVSRDNRVSETEAEINVLVHEVVV